MDEETEDEILTDLLLSVHETVPPISMMGNKPFTAFSELPSLISFPMNFTHNTPDAQFTVLVWLTV